MSTATLFSQMGVADSRHCSDLVHCVITHSGVQWVICVNTQIIKICSDTSCDCDWLEDTTEALMHPSDTHSFICLSVFV